MTHEARSTYKESDRKRVRANQQTVKHIQSKKKQRVLLIEQYIDIIRTVVDRKSRNDCDDTAQSRQV